jgi:hypothetical protein
VVRVVLRAIVASTRVRPVFVSGMPGISFPATKRALLYRSQVDLMVVHSKRERTEFSELAERMGLEQRFGLATLAFLSGTRDHAGNGDAIVFATQAKVPRTRADRMSVLGWLSETAVRHPELRVVVKLRARGGEKQTHDERYPYDVLAAELPALPSNLAFETGPMADHLDAATALVTVSSTAALEAAARGIPTLVLDDFGVSARLINLVFDGSNLLGGSEDLIAARFHSADEGWLDANYFHSAADADWLSRVAELTESRAAGELRLRAEARRGHGGALRHAWDRKRVLGDYDRSFSGRLALAIGIPARWVFLTVRRLRRPAWRTRRTVSRAAIPG